MPLSRVGSVHHRRFKKMGVIVMILLTYHHSHQIITSFPAKESVRRTIFLLVSSYETETQGSSEDEGRSVLGYTSDNTNGKMNGDAILVSDFSSVPFPDWILHLPVRQTEAEAEVTYSFSYSMELTGTRGT